MTEQDQFIWLIGGSVMSVPMCQEIKRRGFKLLLTDGNPKCHCRPQADFFHTVSAYDVESNLNFARAVKGKLIGIGPIKAVLTIGTDAGPTISAISEVFGRAGIGRETAELVKDKIQMRQKLNLPHPYFFVRHRGKPAGYFEPDKFPMAVKSTDQAGSRGFAVAQDNSDLHEIVSEREGEDLLLEQLLIGKDVIPAWRDKYDLDTSEAAFDFFVEDGEVIYANGALRLFWCDQPGIEAGHLNRFEAFCETEPIMAIAQEAAEGLGVEWGPFKIDVKHDERYGWCLLECATRLSGGWDHMYTSPLATGRDVTGVMLDVALKKAVDRAKIRNQKFQIACCLAPRFEPGEIEGWDLKAANCQHIFPLTQDVIKPLTCNQDRPLVVIDVADDGETALGLCLMAAGKIQPVYGLQNG